MNRELWIAWARERAGKLGESPWLLSKWDTIEGVVWPEKKIRLMMEDVGKKLGLDSSMTLLDVGCGPGWIGAALAENARAVFAVDFAPSMIGRAALYPGLKPALADALFLPFGNGSFDRVLIYFTLMNFTDEDDIGRALLEALRVTGPGGMVLAGQMPLASGREKYDREKARYLSYCREAFGAGRDSSRDHSPPIVLFPDDYYIKLEEKLDAPVKVVDSFNHFWREGEPTACSWRVDYIIGKV